MNRGWIISDAEAEERDRKVAEPILMAIIYHRVSGLDDAQIRRELELRGLKIKELRRLKPILERMAHG